MNNAPKLLVPVVILLGAILGLLVFLNDSGATPPPSGVGGDPSSNAESQETNRRPDAAKARAVAPPRESDTVRVPMDTSSANSGAKYDQGVIGRVLGPDGYAIAGAQVYLMPNASGDPFKVFISHQRGDVIPPVASVDTDEQGRFKVGVAKAGETYDLRVVSGAYPDLHHKNINVRVEDYYDAGDLVLQPGVTVQGRVTIEGTTIPVPNVQVSLKSINSMHSVLPTPGRENGLLAVTDQNGFYFIPNAKGNDTVNAIAASPDYAKVEKKNVRVETGKINQLDFELVQGMAIVGYVTDSNGMPVRSAKVMATALSSKTPQVGKTTSNQDGRFEVLDLRDGPYQLTVTAVGYQQRIESPVLSGSNDVTITLESLGSVRVKVLSSKGAPILSYKVSVKRHFPQNPLGVGNVPQVPDRRIAPGDTQDGWAEVAGIPDGSFLVQIEASKHAKTRSEPFTIAPNAPVPEVIVKMTLGGRIVGRVIDDTGNPVAGAVVSSDLNGTMALDQGIGKLLAGFMPDIATKTSDRTDSAGRFRLTKLAHGDYLVRVAHQAYCEGVQQDITVPGDRTIDIGDVILARGAIVHGRTTINGQISGQVEVQLTLPRDQQPQLDAQGRPKNWFSASAVSRNDGTYRLLKRVPPGSYNIFASTGTGQGNPFDKLVMIRQTERLLNVAPGVEAIEVNFDLVK